MMSHQYFKVDVYSHHFVLSRVTPRGREVIEGFARNYIQYGLVKQGRRFVRAPVKVFGSRVADYCEYRFHIEQMAEFTRHLSNMQILPHTYEINYHDFPESAVIEIEALDHWVAKDYQEPIIEYLEADTPKKAKLLEIQTGKGKFQPLDAKIKIPGGWTTMGEVKVGDTITAWDGTATKITAIYPQGQKEVYKVTFADGRSTEAGAEHLWRVYYVNTTPHKRWRVVDTLEMLRLISMPNPRVYVQLIESENTPEADLPVPPYVLGAILGDGGISGFSINVTKLDQELFDNMAKEFPPELTWTRCDHKTQNITAKVGKRNPYLAHLRSLGLMGKRSWEKFIPQIYLHASTHQRLRLLQGLMDTDGTANTLETGGAISYSSTSEQLAKDVQYLVRSLGGIASITSRVTQYTHNEEKKDGRRSYDVNIRFKTPSQLFTIPRKKARTNDDNQYAKDLKLRVKSVEFSRVTETQCISIDHPDKLYVTDDFIVTHNTFCAMKAITNLKRRTCIIVKPMYIEKWVGDIEAITGIKGEDVVVVQGSAQLMALIALAKEGRLTAKFIVISNRTLQNWYSLYEKMGKEILGLGYDCLPGELFQTLAVGVRLIDEVHQDFHLNFKLDLYTHVERSISLSATLKGDDPFLNRMYETAYPKSMRYSGLAYDKYIYAYAWVYRVQKPEQLRTMEYGSTTYSHHAFEKSVMRNKRLMDDYLDMIVAAAMRFHFEKYQKGDKLLIYCSSIQMCTLVVEHLKASFKGVDVRRYVEDDPYENLLDPDVRVSTLLSAGTGHDIPGLTTVILTTAISSSQSNIQGFGRLRKLADKRMQFVYFVCNDVPKHMEYHERKKDLLKTMALEYDSLPYHHPLG